MFFHRLHTDFLPGSGVLKLSREQLDNPNKPKNHHIYKEDFSVETHFQYLNI